MEDNIHPVVKLLVARMESNPEEFTDKGHNRWDYAIDVVEEYGSAEDKVAISSAMRTILLDEAHEWVMDELLNGEERRKEIEKQMIRERSALQQAVYSQQRSAAPTVYSPPRSALGTLQNGVPTTGLGTSAIHQPTALQLGSQTLDETTLAKLKRMAGL